MEENSSSSSTEEAKIKDNEKVGVDDDIEKYIASNMNKFDTEFPFIEKSLFCLTKQNYVRRKCFKVVRAKAFDRSIIFLIVANSIVLAMTDYGNVDSDGIPTSINSWRNLVVEYTEIPFTLCFFFESVVKIITMGFMLGTDTYLHDPWNILDFVVVASSVVGIIPGVPNISALRTLRVLRPLRSLSVIPGMRKIVSSLLAALPALFNVVVLQIFVFCIFGILGIQLFSGQLHSRCRLTPTPVLLESQNNSDIVWPPSPSYLQLVLKDPSSYECLPGVSNFNLEIDNPTWTKSTSPWNFAQPCFWPVDPEDDLICSMTGTGKHLCKSSRTCGSNYDARGNPRFTLLQAMDNAVYNEDMNWGYTSFDSIARAFLTIFQSITMEGWVDILYMCQDSQNPIFAALFFILLVVFGSFFLLNLFLAVICDEFSINADDDDDDTVGNSGKAEIQVKGPIPILYGFVSSGPFSSFIFFIILLNTVVLAMDHHPMPQDLADTLEMINFGLSALFFLEMILKLLGLGFVEYCKDRLNIFDMFIVLTSLVETIIIPPSFLVSGAVAGDSGGALSALRTFRLFRIFKLARNWVSLRILLETIIHTFASIVNFGVLLILFIYIYSLIGIQFFANTFHFGDDGYAIALGKEGYGEAEIPRNHFDDLLWAFVSIFQVLTGENWNTIMYDGWRSGGWPATIYFVSLVILGNFIVMNLFLAILLGNFNDTHEVTANTTSEKGNSLQRQSSRNNNVVRIKVKRMPPKGKSLYIFQPNHPLREFCFKLVTHPRFDNCILLLIIFSSIALAVDNPLYDPDSILVYVLEILDAIMTVLFTLEMLLKVLALGFTMHRGSYLRNSWNILDFIIVVSSLLMLLAQGNPAFKALRSLRALRTFRPLRMISRQPGLKLVVNALFVSIPSVMNVGVVCVLFFLIFSIVGVNYFKGTFKSCQGDIFDSLSVAQQAFLTSPTPWTSSVNDSAWFTSCSTQYQQNFSTVAPTSRFICEECWNATWDDVIPQNFDNVGNAMLTLFEISTTEGWTDVMYAAVDRTDIDMQPIRDANVWWVWFFIAFMIIGSFFVMNLFVGVIIDNFNRMKSTLGAAAFMTEEQLLWVGTQKEALRVSPIRLIEPPSNKNRLIMFKLMHKPFFDNFIMGCIILNTFLMAVQYFGMDDGLSDFLSSVNSILALIFASEAVIKISGLGEMYFRDPWNKFDFMIVVGTAAGGVLEALTGASIGSLAMIVRTFRISRIVRLIKSAKGLQHILMTLYIALPGLSNITSLLFLMLFIFAVMGVQIYSKIGFTNDITSHAHFQDFWTAMLVLLRAATGENWNGLMHSFAASPSGCVVDPPFQSDMCGFNNTEDCIPINGCGNSSIYIYMLAFTLLVTYVMLNLSIAVILEGFADSGDDKNTVLTPGQIMHFQQTWAHFDKRATGFVLAKLLPGIIEKLDPPMGTKGTVITSKTLALQIKAMSLPIYGGRMIHFKDVIKEMAKRVLQDQNPNVNMYALTYANVLAPINKQSQRNMHTGYNADTYYAAVTVQRAAKHWITYLHEKRKQDALDAAATEAKKLKKKKKKKKRGGAKVLSEF